MKLWVAGIACALLLAGTASTAEARFQVRTPAGQVAQPYQQWADASKIPTPNVTVQMGTFACPEIAAGCALIDPRAPFAISLIEHKRWVFLHELGHIWEVVVMDAQAREEFTRLAFPGHPQPWVSPTTGATSGQEVFAEAFRYCARFKKAPVDFFSTYGWEPSKRRHARACRIMRRAYARYQFRVGV